MENSKKKIIDKLKEATVDKAAMQAAFNSRLKAAEDVVKTSLGTNVPPEDVKNIAARLATESTEVGDEGSSPIVQYDSDRKGEVPFLFNGDKWQYVNGIYPNGKKDIAVYRYGHDLAYDYSWFMDNVVGGGKNTTSQIGEVNKEVLDKFIKQYGEEKGKQVYYATANKQGRDEETFKVSENDDEIANRSIGYGVNEPEVGADKYEEYKALMQQLAAEESDEQPVKEGPIGAPQAVPTNDPIKLKTDVAKLMAKLDISAIAPYLVKIDNPTEQAEVIAQFAEKIGVPKNKLGSVINQLRSVAENGKVTKKQLKEAINSLDRPTMTKKDLVEMVSGRKIIKTIKVKDIK